MRLIACMPVRNESWCLGLTARAALMWCDDLVILLHACADRSAEIVKEIQDEHPGHVVVRTHRHECWTEMAHRQQMLEIARAMKATHIAIVDADEILTGNLLTLGPLGNNARQAAWLTGIEGDGDPCSKILQLPGYNLRHGTAFYHANGVWGNRWFSTAFQDDPRLGWAGDRFHHREPMGVKLQPYRPIQQGDGGVMHLWGASERRLTAKHALYKLSERLRWPEKPIAEIDRMYSLALKGDPREPAYGTPDTWTYNPVPQSWWAPYQHLMRHLDLNQEPWQEAECRRLIAEHGRERFAGLDLFGVI